MYGTQCGFATENLSFDTQAVVVVVVVVGAALIVTYLMQLQLYQQSQLQSLNMDILRLESVCYEET